MYHRYTLIKLECYDFHVSDGIKLKMIKALNKCDADDVKQKSKAFRKLCFKY